MDRIWLTRFLNFLTDWIKEKPLFKNPRALKKLKDSIPCYWIVDSVSSRVNWIIWEEEWRLIDKYIWHLEWRWVIEKSDSRKVKRIIIDYIRLIWSITWWIIWDNWRSRYLYPRDVLNWEASIQDVYSILFNSRNSSWLIFEHYAIDSLMRWESWRSSFYMQPNEEEEKKVDLLSSSKIDDSISVLAWIQIVSSSYWPSLRSKDTDLKKSRDYLSLSERDERSFRYRTEWWKSRFSSRQIPDYFVLLYNNMSLNYNDLRQAYLKWIWNWCYHKEGGPLEQCSSEYNTNLRFMWSVYDEVNTEVMSYISSNDFIISDYADTLTRTRSGYTKKRVKLWSKPFATQKWLSYNMLYDPNDLTIDVKVHLKEDWLESYLFWFKFYITKDLLEKLYWNWVFVNEALTSKKAGVDRNKRKAKKRKKQINKKYREKPKGIALAEALIQAWIK